MKSAFGERRVLPDDLEDFSERVFVALGASQENAEVVSRHLVDASLRGVDSHGVSRIPVYAKGIAARDIDPVAKPEILKESSASALIDGRKGFGQVAALFSAEVAVSKAKSAGISAVGVRNLNHVGMLSYYGSILASKGFIAKIFTNGLPRVAPWGGSERVLGTNPLCLAFPRKGREPILIDISTAVVAAFKIVLAAGHGSAIPKGWAVAPDGTPTTDPRAALEGALLPMAGHKGYGLGLSVEILSSILTGSAFSVHIKPIPYSQGGLYIEACSIELFREADEYFRDLEELTKLVKGSKIAEGFEEIYLPGEPEIKEKKLRSVHGIPISDSIWNEVTALAAEHSVGPPPTLNGGGKGGSGT